MSFLSGAKKQDERSFLVCCIESGAVHVALLLVYPQNKPFIVHSVSKVIPFQETPNHERCTATTLQALVDACNGVVTKGVPYVSSQKVQHGHIDHIYCVYGSPWYISQTQEVNIEKENPIIITDKTLPELVKQYTPTDSLHAVVTDEKDAVYILEQSIVGIRLNGYAVDTPIGKEAKHISFSVSSGAISNQFRLYVEESISRFFSNISFTHHCAPTMEFFGIRDMLATENTFLIIDVSAEVTDVSVVRNGTLKETASFPYGTHSALRSFSHSANILSSETLGAVRSLQANKLDTKITKLYTEAAQKAEGEWRTFFEKTLLELEQGGGIPTSAFILGESSEFVLVQKLFIPTNKITNPRTGSPLVVTTLTTDALKSFCLVREGVQLSHPLLIFSSLYIHKTIAMAKGKRGVQ
ncbi:MAG: hypothetical protein NUW02_01760 [Candidatus Campbellbacteria bacterium]|nr:hypothetical protein [Candidatus Campbellbacteria bacterium]